MRKFFKSLLHCFIILLLAFILVNPLRAQEKIKIYFFWSQSCPHCAREKVFLTKLVKEYPQLELISLETGRPETIKIWQEAGEKLNTRIGATPFTLIGNRYFVGYLSDETTGEQIKATVVQALEDGCSDILEETVADSVSCQPEEKEMVEVIKLPLLGEIRTRDVSLPLLTLVVGLLDGFNPCAMWTLLFLISLLLGMENRKRMWILGLAFIVTSAFVYFLFLSAWLNFFLLIGFIFWVRIIIGLVALGAGGYSVRDWWQNKEGGCQVMGDEKRKRVFERIKGITQRKEFFLALGGIILLALAVNLVELVCSAGLPAIYTQILSMTSLARWQYYSYLFLYILFFMIDDLFVFFAAMITLQAVGVESKYARFSRLIGGSLMIIIGVLLLFKPEWLMFS
jgi:thiol-disulfide isomerase/thioredoxin